MRNKLMFSLVVFTVCFNAAFGQTTSEIAAKYGKPENVYSVSERIWMTPDFAEDGQICRMRLYPKRISGSINYLSKDLPFDEFRFVIDKLIPINQRGAKKQPFYGGTWATGGRAMWAIFTYEKITFVYSAGVGETSLGNDNLSANSKPFSLSEYQFPLQNEQTAQDEQLTVIAKPEDDFEAYRTSKVEIVTVSWNGRTCGDN